MELNLAYECANISTGLVIQYLHEVESRLKIDNSIVKLKIENMTTENQNLKTENDNMSTEIETWAEAKWKVCL